MLRVLAPCSSQKNSSCRAHIPAKLQGLVVKLHRSNDSMERSVPAFGWVPLEVDPELKLKCKLLIWEVVLGNPHRVVER